MDLTPEQLEIEVKESLPMFWQACQRPEKSIIMTQGAFAPNMELHEFSIFGKAIKYAGQKGVEIRIICDKIYERKIAE